jgi:hypothetical protein
MEQGRRQTWRSEEQPLEDHEWIEWYRTSCAKAGGSRGSALRSDVDTVVGLLLLRLAEDIDVLDGSQPVIA